MLLLVDNYDSFTFNLVHYFKELDVNVYVIKNNHNDIESIKKMPIENLVISPGPGNPSNTGITNKLIKHYIGSIPILGVCLGHQCLAYCYGANITRAKHIRHGKTSVIKHNGLHLFKNIPQDFTATRYHSLVIDKESLSDTFEIIAESEDDIMAIKHKKHKAYGVQFHPEALLTEYGHQLLQNFMDA